MTTLDGAGAFDTVTVGQSGTASASGTQKYVVIVIAGTDTVTAAALDAAMDDGNTQTGVLRWVKKTTGKDTLKFLALPIQP